MAPSAAKILSARQAAALSKKLKAARKKIVFTNGCFDILHPGHVSLFAFARSKGDVLVVGVNSDKSIHWIKGPQRPIVGLKDRLEVLAALRSVDYLIPFDTPTPEALVASIKPDVMVKGGDWKVKDIAGHQYAKKTLLFPIKAGRSTTNIVEKIKKLSA